MPTVDERLAGLEAKVEAVVDLRHQFADLRHQVAELRSDVNARFVEMNARITELRGDMNGRFEGVNRGFDEVNRRVGSLEAKVDRQFVWLMGMMVTGFLAAIGALVGVR